MEYFELIKNIDLKLDNLVNKLKGDNILYEREDLKQEIYIYLWNEWKKGNFKGKNENYILKGCYFYLKNLLRNKRRKIVSLEEIMEKNGKISRILYFEEKMNNFDFEKIKGILNEREIKVLNMILEGYTTREIGKIFNISHVMVIKIMKRIREKIKRGLPEI